MRCKLLALYHVLPLVAEVAAASVYTAGRKCKGETGRPTVLGKSAKAVIANRRVAT